MLAMSPVLFVMMIPVLVLAQDEASQGNEMFNAMDTDASGDLNAQELQDAFVKYDVNEDDEVTWDEYFTFIVSQDPSLEYSLKFLWAAYDFNSDGRLTKEDFEIMHDVIDDNDDGMDDREEFIKWAELLFTAADAQPKRM